MATTTGVVWQGSPAYDDLYRSGRSYGSIWDRELNPDVNGGHFIGTPEGDAHFTRLGLDSIRERPLDHLRYSARKVGYFWLGHPSADWADGRVLDPRSLAQPRWEVPLIMGSRLVPLAGLVALVVWRRGPWGRELAVVTVALASFTVLHAALWAELRLSQPMVPLLWVLIGAALAGAGRGRAAGSSRDAAAQRSGRGGTVGRMSQGRSRRTARSGRPATPPSRCTETASSTQANSSNSVPSHTPTT